MTPRMLSTVGWLTTGLALLMPAVAQAQPADPLIPLVDAAVARLQVAEPVAASKFRTGGLIKDPDREQQVLDGVGVDADRHGIDPGYVTAAFRDQIDATVAIEYARLAEWTFDPAAAPADAPDLASSRAAIDDLNRAMVTEMSQQWAVLHSPACIVELDRAREAVAQERGLDALYRRAVDVATRSYCR